MKVVIDVETNGLKNPTKIWCIVCKDIDTGKIDIFREVTHNETELRRFDAYCDDVHTWIGHNIIQFDLAVLDALLNLESVRRDKSYIDTLVISKLVNYSRPQGHSVEAYGEEFGLPKGANHSIEFFTRWSQELQDYCVRDVDITHQVYSMYLKIINAPQWQPAIQLEQDFQYVVGTLHNNGFAFNTDRAGTLLKKVKEKLGELDDKILRAFPPKEVLVREFTPKLTKFGTISRTSVPRSLWPQIHEYTAGQTYRHTRLVDFNPASHKQVIDVLHGAGWKPLDKTKTHVEIEREIQKLKRIKFKATALDLESLYARMVYLEKFGWKINETNLSTLPEAAPSPARLLAQRILYESRRRTLTEWLGLVQDDGRIHGKFYGLGAWTHRMAHQEPNTANIPNEFDIATGNKKLLGKEMRSLWQAPRKRLLVGVDAEAIQLRVFAHMIDDKELTDAIVNGKKSDKTDPHSLNQRVFGTYCKTRNAAKHSLYAIFFGGRANKVSEIMGCTKSEAEEAIDKLIERYPGLAHLERDVFPVDAKRGWFEGLDGRRVAIPGDTDGQRKHLCMSGYLQNGEAIIMKMACLRWINTLKEYDSLLVNFVHDEWQTETPNNMEIALKVASLQAESLRIVGEELSLRCPMAGSFYDDVHNDYTIGTNWSVTH